MCTGVRSLHGYQRLLVAQPVKLGGTGLCCMEEMHQPTFLGGLKQALPHMVVGEDCETRLVPGLRAAVSSMAGPEHWGDLLAAGSRTVTEFRNIWREWAAAQ